MDMRCAPTLAVQLWACHYPSLGLSFPFCAIRIGLCGLHVVVCLVAQSCPTLCNPLDCSPLHSSVHGIFRQEHWNGLPFPTPGYLPNPGIELVSLMPSALTGRVFTTAPPGKPLKCSKIFSKKKRKERKK